MKRITIWLGLALVSAMAMMFSASPLRAAINLVTNPGFEDPAVPGPPAFNLGPITGWQQHANGPSGTGVSGVWRPAAYGAIAMDPAINGLQAAYAGNGPGAGDNGAYIYQDVGPVITGGVYSLSLLVGERNDYPIGNYEIALGTFLSGTFVPWDIVQNPVTTPGFWSPVSVTYSSTDDTGDLYIFLEGGLGPAGIVQASFDNVSLIYTPEPGSLVIWSLIGLTIGAAGWRRRRRQKLVA